MPGGQVDAMLAAPAANRRYDPSAKPIMRLIRELTARRDLDRISVRKAGFSLELRRSARCRP
jgi:hypothetical protein